MFRLQRFFSTSSLVIILITAVALGTFYRYLSINLLLDDGENRNVAVTRLLANGLWQQIEPLLAASPGPASVTPDTERLDARIKNQITGLQVVKIKIYSPVGMTVFSTDSTQIGEDQRDNPAIARALLGKVSNSFVRRNQLNPYDQRQEVRDLMQTYLPVRHPENDEVVGIFEVYSDYTALLARVRNVQWLVMGGTGLILTLLYGALLLVVRHADKVIARQSRQLQSTVSDLETTRDQLEVRVAERTQTLNDSNRRLEQEVKQRQRMERIVREREQRLRGVMDNLLNAIIVTDAQGAIQSVNPSAERLFGYDRLQLLGSNLLKLIAAERIAGRPDLRKGPVDIRLGELLETRTELEARCQDGSLVPVELAITRTEQGGEPLFIASFRDVSDRRAAELKLEQSRNKLIHQEKMAAIGSLSAGIVHEIGNPIAAIEGLIQQICEHDNSDHELPPAVRDNLDLTLDQTQRLIKINRDVAEFASPQGEDQELVNLNNLLGRTCRLLRYDDRLRNTELELALDQSLPAIYSDGNQLIQVMMNLVSNAADAVNSRREQPGWHSLEGRIRVQTRQAGDRVYFSVEDNGCGMDSETAGHALEAFYTTKATGKGTGLGLSICHSIVSARGGQISIETAVNAGTRIDVELPIGKAGNPD